MSTDDDWLKALTASCRDAPQKTAKAEPATKPALAAYAKATATSAAKKPRPSPRNTTASANRPTSATTTDVPLAT